MTGTVKVGVYYGNERESVIGGVGRLDIGKWDHLMEASRSMLGRQVSLPNSFVPVVITSYGTLASDYSGQKTCSLFSHSWDRGKISTFLHVE